MRHREVGFSNTACWLHADVNSYLTCKWVELQSWVAEQLAEVPLENSSDLTRGSEVALYIMCDFFSFLLYIQLIRASTNKM